MNKEIIKELFPEVIQTITKNLCSCCNQPITEFKDELSKKEYNISGMCQTCQDEVFY